MGAVVAVRTNGELEWRTLNRPLTTEISLDTLNLPGMWMSLYLTDTVCTPNSFGTKWTAYRPSCTSLITASSVTPPGEVTVAPRSNDVIPEQNHDQFVHFVRRVESGLYFNIQIRRGFNFRDLPGILKVSLHWLPTSVIGTASLCLWIFSLCLLVPSPVTYNAPFA
jgi:hypothetical protein